MIGHRGGGGRAGEGGMKKVERERAYEVSRGGQQKSDATKLTSLPPEGQDHPLLPILPSPQRICTSATAASPQPPSYPPVPCPALPLEERSLTQIEVWSLRDVFDFWKLVYRQVVFL